MDDIEAADVLLTVNDDASPTHIASTGDDNDVPGVKLDEIGDFILLDIEFDGVIYPDAGVRVADGSAIVSNDVWDTLGTKSQFSDLEKLVASFLWCDAMDGETTFNVVEKAEVFTRLFNGDDVWRIDTAVSSLGWEVGAKRTIPMKPAG